MMLKQEDAEKPSELGRFLSYSAVVTSKLPASGNIGATIPIPFIYAAMAGLNSLVLTNLRKNPPTEISKIKTDRASFRKQLTSRRRWLGDVAQFNNTLSKLNDWGYLHRLGNEIRVESPMIESLLGHAQAIFTFMTGHDSETYARASDIDWLTLNEEVFAKFFFGDFGNIWRDLREEVNGKLRQATEGPRHKKKSSRSYTQDFVNRDPNLWVAFNAIALGGPGNKYKLFEHIDKYKLNNLAPETGQVENAAELLVSSGVFTHENRIYDIAMDMHRQAANYRTAIENGLAVIKVDCMALKRKISSELADSA